MVYLLGMALCLQQIAGLAAMIGGTYGEFRNTGPGCCGKLSMGVWQTSGI
jgi:hypothetical protein